MRSFAIAKPYYQRCTFAFFEWLILFWPLCKRLIKEQL